MSLPVPSASVHVRDLHLSDLPEVIRIDTAHTSRPRAAYWTSVLGDFLQSRDGPFRMGLAAERHGRLVGHLLGEVRAFEFGSEPCGWIFAVGVDPDHVRQGVGATLLHGACRRFASVGIGRVRTMVRRDDLPMLSFFRAAGMVGGPFVQLELNP